MTQERLGEILDKYDRSTISNYETQLKHEPPRTYVERVARALNIPVEWFYDGMATDPPAIGRAIHESPAVPYGSKPHVKYLFPLHGESGTFGPPPSVPFSMELLREGRFAVKVKGDRMAPRAPHGSFCLVHPDPNPPENFIVVLENSTLRQSGAHGPYELRILLRAQPRELADTRGPAPLGDDWSIIGYAVGIRTERGQKAYTEEGDDDGIRG